MPIKSLNDGPIPGENYTSDTKNYPWHRPPEITDLDKAIEVSVKQMTKKDRVITLLAMLRGGVTVAQTSQIFCMSGVASGKWTVDFALLLAGPVAHMMQIIAEGQDIKYEMGLDDTPVPTDAFFKAAGQIDPKKQVTAIEDPKALASLLKGEANNIQQKPQTGFMGSPDPNPAATDPSMAQGAPQSPDTPPAPSGGFAQKPDMGQGQ